MKKIVLTSIIISVIISSATVIAYYYFDNQTPEIIYKIFNSNIHRKEKDFFPFQYVIESPKIPKRIKFCGEKVPIENFDVKERIERELISNTYWHSSTLLAMKRSGRWFPVIVPILKNYGIPEDFKYLAIAESNLENVVSPAHAVGFWQLLKSTAKQYGLEVNSSVDERYDVEKSTVAACKYLLKAKKKFGSWTLAAASYNIGINSIQKQIKRQATNNYYNMNFEEETARYLFRLIAIKIIFENPERYGFSLKSEDYYKPLEYKIIKVKKSIKNLGKYANSLGLNYRTLKIFNPWLRDSFIKVKKGKFYKIKIPVEGTIEIIK